MIILTAIFVALIAAAIALFGADATIFPGTEVINTLSPGTLWGSYVRYIGAGAVATGGVISLIKSFPMIVRTFKATMATFGKKTEKTATVLPRTQQDLPMPLVIGLVILLVLLIWLLPTFPSVLAATVTPTSWGRPWPII